MHLKRFLSILTMPLFTFGCAMAPKIVHLAPTQPVAEAKFSKPVCITISEFKDSRENPQVLGHTYNLGVKTSDVKTYGDVAKWVKSAYTTEFKKAGSKDCSSTEGKVILSGSIQKINQSESWNIDTLIKVNLTLISGKTKFEQTFEGKSSQISHAASDGEFTDSLYKALRDLMKSSVPILVSKVESDTQNLK